jgi:predicted Ser/Thr protein kinase
MKGGSDLGQEPSVTGPYSPGSLSPSIEGLAKQFPQLEILELLGQGGMGIVYKARQPRLDRFVALKILPAEAGRDSAFAERFAREARALAKLTHPNIVVVYDFGESDGQFYLLMEFVDGVNLRHLLREQRLKPEEALKIVPQICEALQYAHDQGVIHRDIKPENILLDKRGHIKIADFGLAKLLGLKAADSALTGSQQVMGTPHYMAPEQMEKPLTVDHRADIYSLGVVFYEMLTGELPLGRFAPPSQKVQVDVRLDEVVLRTLEKEPEKRYQHVSDVKTEVETITHTGPLPQPIHTSRNQGKRPSKEKFAICVTFAAAVVFAATFMPWEEFHKGYSVTVIGWEGYVTVGHLKLPNSLLVLSAIFAAALCWLKALSIWETPPVLVFALAAYGLMHAGLFSFVNIMQASPGIGWFLSSPVVGLFLTILAFAGILLTWTLERLAAWKEPAQLVRGPADGLVFLGCMALAAAVLGLWMDELQWNQQFYLVVMSIINAVFGLFTITAGTLMRRLSSRLSTLACIITSGLLIPVIALDVVLEWKDIPAWPFLIPTWLGVPIATWATIVLFQSDVKTAFSKRQTITASQSREKSD